MPDAAKPVARDPPERGSRACHAESIAYVFLFNIPVMMLAGSGFLSGVPEGTSFSGWMAALVAFVSNTIMFLLVLNVPLAPAAVLLRRRWFTLGAVPAACAVLSFYVFVDSIIYALYRMHFNWMLWNVLTTPGADDSYTVSAGTFISAFTVGAIILAAELGFSLGGLPFLRRRKWLPRIRSRRGWGIVAALLFAVVLLDKGLYAWGDLTDRVEITRSKYLFPLYQPVTMKRFAKRVFGMEVGPRESMRLDTRSSSLDYPKSPLVFPEGGARPNVVVIAVEGGRFDMLSPDIMPHLHRWGGKNIVCERHMSAGSCSRFGIFGLIYGIYGTYWHRVLAERRGPVLVSELKELGYAFRILSCTDLNFPEFRRTAFVEVLDDVSDKFDAGLPRLERDRVMTDRFIEFLDGNRERGGGPFFAFLFYDAPHQPYLYRPQDEVFSTALEPGDINYVKLAKAKTVVVPLLNRFKNSMHYVDSQVARAIAAIEERGLMDGTLVFVTGDHGEEFGESGLLGHNGAFNRWQAQAFMVAHVPGEPPRRVKRLTSHVDLVPTVFGFMGVRNPVSDYGQGMPLYAGSEQHRGSLASGTGVEGQRSVLVAAWDTAAIVDEDTVTTFGLEAYNSEVEILDWDYVPLADQRAALAGRKGQRLEALAGMRAFTK